MARMKVFARYLIIFVAIYFLFDFFAYRYLVNTYKNIKSYEVTASAPEVTIKEAKATAVNGYVVAQVKNNTGAFITKKYVKIDLYTTRGNNVGTVYSKIENFEADKTVEIRQNFKCNNVTQIKISFTDDDVDKKLEQQNKELNEKVNKWLPVVGLVSLFAIV